MKAVIYMELTCYEWNQIRLTDVFHVHSPEAGTVLCRHGNTDIFQIGLKLRGKTDILYDNKNYDYHANSILYLPKEPHSTVDYRSYIAEQGESLCIFFDTPTSLPTTPLLLPDVDKQLLNLFLELHGAYRQKNRDIFLCMSLFYHILSCMNQSSKKNTSPHPERMNEVLLYIQNHAAEPYIDFALLAEGLDLSIDRFRHIFKETCGISPLQYFHRVKLDLIKAFLHDRSYSIQAVASLAGFNDFNYFSRFFKKHVGMSPMEYRKNSLI